MLIRLVNIVVDLSSCKLDYKYYIPLAFELFGITNDKYHIKE